MRIKSKRVWFGGQFQPLTIEMNNGHITGIDPDEKADMDYGDLRIVPGFIDIHCHGAWGFDTDSTDAEGLRRWTENIVHDGITGFLPTTVTESEEVLTGGLKNVADVVRNGYKGAEILGIHMEGPYLDMAHKGAQPASAIVPPSIEQFQRFMDASDNLIRLMTIAPEHDKDHALIRYCARHNVRISLGHSGASYEEALRAFQDGASSVTHTFNGMDPMHHRNPGLAGAALRQRDVYSEIICDCHHVRPEVLNIFFHAKNPDKAIMISDSLLCKGQEPGWKFIFGGQECVVYPDHTAHLVKEGNLAGSTMHTNEGLRNLVDLAGVPFDRALASCTHNPAALLGLDKRIGTIAVGYDADIAVLKDDYTVEETYCKGQPQF